MKDTAVQKSETTLRETASVAESTVQQIAKDSADAAEITPAERINWDALAVNKGMLPELQRLLANSTYTTIQILDENTVVIR